MLLRVDLPSHKIRPMTPSASEFEKLGVFYLGRPYDPLSKQPKDGLLLYESKDLVTHAVCVGMTGSGKTGLGIVLLEEAAIDGIPAIVIDPKGDLSNLLLTFPDLASKDFEPWIDPGEAERAGVARPAYAEQIAEKWKKGLASWGEDGTRIKRLRDAADFAVYTPGSTRGRPVSVLSSFGPPDVAVRSDAEQMKQRVATTVSSLLGLIGVAGDPLRSREHILLSTLLGTAWSAGKSLDLASLIQQIQAPPMNRIGVLDLESFYPAKERFELVMALNNVLASPGFSAWTEGEALDISAMLRSSSGKPRISIFSIAHLSDPERMFFVSLLLNQIVSWMRAQSGTSSLRAMVFMDEIFGYFPPVAEPPSKLPLLTLLKQARAFGVGVVLATQNPVDLDYKGLANAGTWFVGRLQTERDKARLMDGLESAAATAGHGFDRAHIGTILASLKERVFLMNNVHEDAPVTFETRWTLSYLRGPLSQDEIQTLTHSAASAAAAPERPAAAKATARAPATPRIAIPPDVPQLFAPLRGTVPEGSRLYYQPMLLGAAQVGFQDAKLKVSATRELVLVTPFEDRAIPVRWEASAEARLELVDLEKTLDRDAELGGIPPEATKKKSYDGWAKQLSTWLFANQTLELLKSASRGLVSSPDESERDFRARLALAARETRDALKEALKKKYAPKLSAVEDKIRRAEEKVAREKSQATQAQLQTAISFGTTLLGAFLGRKALSAQNVGRAASTARGVSRAMKETGDVNRATESLGTLLEQKRQLEEAFQTELTDAEAKSDPSTEPLETLTIRPSKTRITVKIVALVWLPHFRDAEGALTPAWE